MCWFCCFESFLQLKNQHSKPLEAQEHFKYFSKGKKRRKWRAKHRSSISLYKTVKYTKRWNNGSNGDGGGMLVAVFMIINTSVGFTCTKEKEKWETCTFYDSDLTPKRERSYPVSRILKKKGWNKVASYVFTTELISSQNLSNCSSSRGRK